MDNLNFNLGDKVSLSMSGEHGVVIGIAIYTNSEPSLLVRYCAGDGRQVEQWHYQDAVIAA